jgi:DNA-binding winged helix-turn-helix (wHTH) protein/TolB-like protein/Tfp pilus assembly protein PilF
MAARNNHIFEFSGFRLIPGEGLLLRGTEQIPLSIKAFSTLLLLVERHGHLVQKAELIEEVWENAFVEEAVVSRSIWSVRHALGDTSKETFIQTVPRRGYRFVAPVRIVTDCSGAYRLSDLRGNGGRQTEAMPSPMEKLVTNGSGVEISVEPQPSDEPNDRRLPTATISKYKIAAAVAGVMLITAAVVAGYIRYFSTPPLSGSKKLAILPLKPIDQANRNPLYEVGVADSLINRLSPARGLVVRSLGSVRKYSETETDPVAAGREQQVDYVLASNYQMAEGKIRVTSQLINLSTGETEEQYKFEKDASNTFATQDALVDDFSNRLMTRFNASPSGTAKSRGTINEEAYRFYQQGMNLIEQRDAEQAQMAIGYFDQAIRLDPNYAAAYAGKTRAHKALGTLAGLGQVEFQKAWESAQKALTLDSSLADGYAARGELQYKFQLDWTSAEHDFLRALDLEPNNANALYLYGEFLGHDKRFDDSIRAIDRALEMDPNNLLFQRDRGRMLYFARRYDEAITQLKHVTEIDRNYQTAYNWLFFSYLVKGDQASAYECLLRRGELRPEGAERYRAAYNSAGFVGALHQFVGVWGEAKIHSFLNEKEQAFAALEETLAKGKSEISMLYADPVFDPLRDDPRYDVLVKRIRKK